MKIERKQAVIEMLMKSEEMMTVSEIARRLELSVKTVRNELRVLDGIVADFKCTIQKIPGKGIKLCGKDLDQQNLYRFMFASDTAEMTPTQRQQEIWLRLFKSSQAMLMKELCASLYVSHATITNDVRELNERLCQHQVTITYQKSEGLELSGNEIDIRNAFVDEYFRKILGDTNALFRLDGDKLIFNSKLTALEQAVQVDIIGLIPLIQWVESKLNYKFTAEAIVGLALEFAAAIIRISAGYMIEIDDETADILYACEEMKVCVDLERELSKFYQIEIPTSEKYFFLMLIIGARQSKKKITMLSKMSKYDRTDIIHTTTKFMRQVQDELGLDLNHDKALFENLLNHIRTSVYRMLFGLKVDNPLLAQIKQEYPRVYYLVADNVETLEHAFQVKYPESEIGYLALYFVLAMETVAKKVRALVVCASGLGISQLLVTRLEKLFQQIEVVGAVSVFEVSQFMDADVDMVISTVAIEELEWVKTIVVNPILGNDDIKKLTKELCLMPAAASVAAVFHERNIYFEQMMASKKEVLTFLYTRLAEKDYVEAEFLPSLWRREEMGSTYIGNHTAVVHGEMDFVKHSVLQVLRLSEPIDWDEQNQVDVIINVVSTRNQSIYFSKVFRALGNLLDEEEFWQRLHDCQEEKSLARLLNKELANDN